MHYIYRLFLFIGAISTISLIIISYLTYQIINPEKTNLDDEYDAIVILSGNPERARIASNLFKTKYSKYILLSKEDRGIKNYLNPRFSKKTYELYQDIILKSQIDSNKIVLFGTNNTSTYDEAISLNKLDFKDIKKILIVTDKYHIFRTQVIFNNVISKYEIDFYYQDDMKDWISNKTSILTVFSEILKSILYYIFTDFDGYLGKI